MVSSTPLIVELGFDNVIKIINKIITIYSFR
jgi:hypothetical protein